MHPNTASFHQKIKNFLGRSVRLECPRYLWIHYWQCFYGDLRTTAP